MAIHPQRLNLLRIRPWWFNFDYFRRSKRSLNDRTRSLITKVLIKLGKDIIETYHMIEHKKMHVHFRIDSLDKNFSSLFLPSLSGTIIYQNKKKKKNLNSKYLQHLWKHYFLLLFKFFTTRRLCRSFVNDSFVLTAY